jgi:hypothetical protein
MPTKKQPQPRVSTAETMKMTIEFADNGIILRDPDCIDNVELAIQKESYNDIPDNTNQHIAVGKNIYEWLLNVVLLEHNKEFNVTGFDLEVKAKCTGREFEKRE